MKTIAIRNAGLVLANAYIPLLFERLLLVKDKQFVSAEAQSRAVHYLQFLVSGQTQTEESSLPLNKILCGLALNAPVPSGITIPDEEKKLITGLVEAMISHWPVIGDVSVNGFRANWLLRDGNLRETEDKWELTVEKRPYDILINKSPFSFSIIKYNWMSLPLHVNWPY